MTVDDNAVACVPDDGPGADLTVHQHLSTSWRTSPSTTPIGGVPQAPQVFNDVNRGGQGIQFHGSRSPCNEGGSG